MATFHISVADTTILKPFVVMSSFRRKAPSLSQCSGTKPFLNGQALVSSGLRELDAALGGGFLVRSVTLVENSPSSESLGVDLLRYFVAEGVADGKQRVLLAAPDAQDFVCHQVPLELSQAQRQVKQQLSQQRKEEGAAELTIAWQYAKYEQQQQQEQHKQRFCYSYDLSKVMHKEMLLANEPVAVDLLADKLERAEDVYERLYISIEQLAKEDRGGQVLRVGVMGLGSPLLGAADASHMMALIRFFKRLQGLLTKSNNVVALVLLGSDVQSAFPTAFVNELRHGSDSVLTLSSFAGTRDLLPEELLEFQGSLTLRKLPRVHALACHAPRNTRFGVKRERRKLKIEKFHLPPEGSRSSNSSSCGSNATNSGTDPLAF